MYLSVLILPAAEDKKQHYISSATPVRVQVVFLI